MKPFYVLLSNHILSIICCLLFSCSLSLSGIVFTMALLQFSLSLEGVKVEKMVVIEGTVMKKRE